MNYKLILIMIFCGLLGSGCGGDRSAIQLKVTMLSPVDSQLNWEPVPNAAGYIIEYTNDLKEQYATVGLFPASRTAFTHHRLIPKTEFIYRIRAFYGPASSPIEVSLPKSLTDSAYAAAYALPEDYHWAAPATIPDTQTARKSSIRNTNAMAEATPIGLKATLNHTISGFALTWTDRASDEEGFLLEKVSENSPDFIVCAIVEPNINSFGWAFEPPERNGHFRIRAFYFGKPSNVAKITTGIDPEFGP